MLKESVAVDVGLTNYEGHSYTVFKAKFVIYDQVWLIVNLNRETENQIQWKAMVEYIFLKLHMVYTFKSLIHISF